METFDRSSALLVIDMLNDFVREGRPLQVPDAWGIIPVVQCAREDAYGAGAAVVYVCDNHLPDDPEFEQWGPHAVAGTEGAQVIAELAPKIGDIIVPKRHLLPFFETELDQCLRDVGVRHVVLTGVLTDICVYHTASDAAVRGYRVSVLADGVAALSRDDHEHALRQMARLFGAKLLHLSAAAGR